MDATARPIQRGDGMSKYIIEIAEEYEEYFKGVLTCGIVDGKFAVDVIAREDLEELNSDYINEHYGELQDEAYQRGFEAGSHEATTIEYQKGLEDGKKQAKVQAELDVCHDIEKVAREHYKRGLDDAWEAARKIVTWPDRSLINSDEFDLEPGESIFTKYPASEAIARLKAYEEEQEADKIKVGDEVVVNGLRCVVMKLDEKGNVDRYFTSDGKTFGNITGFLNNEVTKTGRYFPQVAELLEAMKGGEE